MERFGVGLREREADQGLAVMMSSTKVAWAQKKVPGLRALRYFYESFPSIEALAEVVFEDVRTPILARAAPAIMEGGAANARPAIEGYVRAVTEDPRVLRLLAFETSEGPLARYRDSFATRAVETWFSLVRPPSTRPPSADRRAPTATVPD